MVDIRNPLGCDEAMARLKAVYSKNRDPSGVFLQSAYDLIKSVYEKQADFISTRYKVKSADGSKTPLTMPFLQYRLNIACIMAENLRANADIVLSALMGPAIKLRFIYRSEIGSALGVQALDRVAGRLQSISNTSNDAVKKCDEIDLMLFDMAIENVYNDLHKKLHRNRRPQLAYIKQAYKLASAAHRGVYRQSGEPYIIHPLMVADILVDAEAESEIIAAALLHDVLEDSDNTREDIEAISPQIYRYVNAVTSVEKEYEEYKRQKEELGEDYDEQEKEDLDRETVNKLIQCATEDESMIYALYIKAADRLHNLSTIDGMPVDKIRAKLNETEEYYLPVFRAFGLNGFVEAIEDQMWRVSNLGNGCYEAVSEAYDSILDMNSANIKSTQSFLEEIVNTDISKYCKAFSVQSFLASVSTVYYYPYQVYRRVNRASPEQKIKSISKQSTPACFFNIIVEERNSNDLIMFSKLFVKAFNDGAQENGRVITDYALEPVSHQCPEKKRLKLVIEDTYYTTYVIYIYNQEDYFVYSNGSSKGIYLPEREDADALAELEGAIDVYCPDNAVVRLPKGSTALDFAFRIHIEIGMYALKASINGSTASEKQLYAILTEGDKVEIEYDSEKAENFGGKKCEGAYAKIEWLNHVKTNQARRIITRWLHEKYECGA